MENGKELVRRYSQSDIVWTGCTGGGQLNCSDNQREIEMKRYLSELIGTFVLVFMGCGTAMLVGCDP